MKYLANLRGWYLKYCNSLAYDRLAQSIAKLDETKLPAFIDKLKAKYGYVIDDLIVLARLRSDYTKLMETLD